ncbi:hypothetical protein QZH41_015115, partial [Actinostola sp. cb2023]
SRIVFTSSRYEFIVSREKFIVSREKFIVSREKFIVSREKFIVSREKFIVSREKFIVSRYEFIVSRYEFIVSRYEFIVSREEFIVSRVYREVLGALCHIQGPSVYIHCKDQILSSVSGNLERKMQDDSITIEEVQRKMSSESQGDGRTEPVSRTNMPVDEPSDDLQPTASSIALEKNAIVQHGDQFADYLKKGLSDNWSQVRLAASMATRQFLQTLPTEARERFYPKLLPAMCLNRYYVAEGVRIYSQKTWKMVMGMEGKHLVEKYIKETVEFYVIQTKADNHAVREAACACIAELGTKVNPDCDRPYVTTLLDALVVCFKDDSWPVRDAACVACGNFILCFPEECRCTLVGHWPLKWEEVEAAWIICLKEHQSLGKSLMGECICLVVELSDNAKSHQEVISALPLMAKATEIRHYTQHPYLLETVCKQVRLLHFTSSRKAFRQENVQTISGAVYECDILQHNQRKQFDVRCSKRVLNILRPVSWSIDIKRTSGNGQSKV